MNLEAVAIYTLCLSFFLLILTSCAITLRYAFQTWNYEYDETTEETRFEIPDSHIADAPDTPEFKESL